MPELSDSILPVTSPTPEEIAAQILIRWCALGLQAVMVCLRGVEASLLYPPDAEDMGEGRAPQSVAFALRGTLECVLADDLEPALVSLEEAVALTPAALYAEWQRKQAR